MLENSECVPRGYGWDMGVRTGHLTFQYPLLVTDESFMMDIILYRDLPGKAIMPIIQIIFIVNKIAVRGGVRTGQNCRKFEHRQYNTTSK